jgi:hypothetical protein
MAQSLDVQWEDGRNETPEIVIMILWDVRTCWMDF